MKKYQSSKTTLVSIRIPNDLKRAIDRLSESWSSSLTKSIVGTLDFNVNTLHCENCKKILYARTFTDDDANKIVTCECEGVW